MPPPTVPDDLGGEGASIDDTRRMTFRRFDYLHYAIDDMPGAEHTLCLSGVPEPSEAELREPAGEVPASASYAPSPELHARWRAALSTRYGVPEDHLSPALGCSGGVFLALTALMTLTGGPVAIEDPAYGVFASTAALHGRETVPLPRPASTGHRLDLERVETALGAGASVVCLTDLHNPTGVALTADEVGALRELAARHDAWVLLDEVYRDFLPGDVGTAYDPTSRIVCTSSLTKVYGVSAPRLGWIAAPPAVTRRIAEVRAVVHGVDPVPSIAHAVRALSVADELRARSRRLARRARRVMDGWVEREERVTWVPPDAGLTGLVRVEGLRDSLELARALRRELDVQVVPGAFFGAEGHLRLSFGLPPAALQRALDVLSLGMGALLRH